MKTNNIRPKKDRIRALSVHEIARRFDVTENYVRQIIRGDAEQETIKREYSKMYKSLQNTLTA